MFGSNIKASMLMSVSTFNDNFARAKEYETAVKNAKVYTGNMETAASWFEELCTIVVRFRLEKSKLNMLLLQKL